MPRITARTDERHLFVDGAVVVSDCFRSSSLDRLRMRIEALSPRRLEEDSAALRDQLRAAGQNKP